MKADLIELDITVHQRCKKTSRHLPNQTKDERRFTSRALVLTTWRRTGDADAGCDTAQKVCSCSGLQSLASRIEVERINLSTSQKGSDVATISNPLILRPCFKICLSDSSAPYHDARRYSDSLKHPLLRRYPLRHYPGMIILCLEYPKGILTDRWPHLGGGETLQASGVDIDSTLWSLQTMSYHSSSFRGRRRRL